MIELSTLNEERFIQKCINSIKYERVWEKNRCPLQKKYIHYE
jgi:hypothetical protein